MESSKPYKRSGRRAGVVGASLGFVPLVALVVGAAAVAGMVGCRGADPGDLVSSVPTVGTDGGTVEGRITVYCDVSPSPPDSKMVDVPAGAFPMGCNASVDDECRADEKPQHMVTLNDFKIDATEVTAAQYFLCVQAGACLAAACAWDPCILESGGNLPIACVVHSDAEAYCAWKQKRLPTEAEWEKAARGTTALKYPWGNDSLDCMHANLAGCEKGTMAVGSYPKGASPYGALDMSGNVVEFVADVYDASYYASSPAENPDGPGGAGGTGSFGGRGGGWRSAELYQRTSVRDYYESTYVKDSLGFRCAE